jgi:hypothetical protein
MIFTCIMCSIVWAPSPMIVTPDLPVLYVADAAGKPECHARVQEYGCSVWHDYYWCQKNTYRFQLAKHSA